MNRYIDISLAAYYDQVGLNSSALQIAGSWLAGSLLCDNNGQVGWC